MTVRRMDNVSIVVANLPAAVAFFRELGLNVEGEATVEGAWVDQCVGLDNVKSDIAMMVTPDGHSRIELTRFHRPAPVARTPHPYPANALGISRIMFAVEDIDDTVARLGKHGGEVVREIVQYQSFYRLCYLRGPEGILLALAQQLTAGSEDELSTKNRA